MSLASERHPMNSSSALRAADSSLEDGTTVASSAKLNALTPLRFIAAGLIVVHHSRGSFGFSPDLWSPFVLGQAVSFFFVLSGFVLTYVYPSLNTIGKGRFWLARVARIWPAHVCSLGLLFFLLPSDLRTTQQQYSSVTLLANIFLVHAWIPRLHYFFSFNAPSWSVSTELGFYLAFPILIRNWEQTWMKKLPLTFLLTVSLIALSNWLDAGAASNEGTNAASFAIVHINPAARLFEFTLGMTTALAWRRLRSTVLVGRATGTLLELSVAALVAQLMYRSAGWADAAGRVPWIGTAGAEWLRIAGVPCVGFALLILVMALELGIVSTLLSLPLPVLAGELSYSVYLVHQLLIRYYNLNATMFPAAPNWLAYAMFWSLTLTIAYLGWLAIERPCRSLLASLWPLVTGKKERARSVTSRGISSPLPAWRSLGAATGALTILALPVAYAVHCPVGLVEACWPGSRHPHRYALETGSVAELISIDGSPIPVLPEAVEGKLDEVRAEGNFVRLLGWAGDVKNGQPAERILVFVNDALFFSGRTQVSRPDVARSYGKADLDRAGFSYRLPMSEFKGRSIDIRLFGVSNGRVASELRYPGVPGEPEARSLVMHFE